MIQGIHVRRARDTDAVALTAIAFAAKRHWGYPEAWIAAWSEQLTQRPEDLRTRPAWVASDEAGVAVGFVVLDEVAHEWSIEHLWILPSHHGRGIGRRLLQTALDFVSRVRPGRVRVESDPNAEAFYAHCGARRAGVVPAPVLGTSRELPLLIFDVEPGDAV